MTLLVKGSRLVSTMSLPPLWATPASLVLNLSLLGGRVGQSL